MYALCWKEYREQRGGWLLVAGSAALLVVVAGLAAGRLDPGEGGGSREGLLALIYSIAVAYGVFCGSRAFAGEIECETQCFLDVQAPRLPLWRAKVMTGALLVLGQALWLAGVLLELGPRPLKAAPEPASVPVLAVLALSGFAWGLVGATWGRSVWAAVLSGAALAGAGWLVALAAAHALGGAALWAVSGALALGGLAWSRRAFCRLDRERAAPQRRAGWLTLAWLTYCEGRGTAVRLLLAALALGVLLPWAEPLLWPLAVVALGAACGAAAFGDGAARRFSGDQRLPAWQVWSVTAATWLTWAAAAALALGAGILVNNVLAFLHGSLGGDGGSWLVAHLTQPSGQLLVAGLLLSGFAAGLATGMVLRRGLAALAALAVGALASCWAPTYVRGGADLWPLFVPPLFLLAASRLTYWRWAAGATSGRFLAGGAALAVACTAGFVWHRAAEFPDIGAPFNSAAFERSLDALRDNKAGPLLREAARQFGDEQRRAFVALGGAKRGTAANVDNWYRENVNNPLIAVRRGGWPKDAGELGRILDALFAGEWVATAKAAAAEPLGLIQDPRSVTLQTAAEQALLGGQLWRLGELFVARAAQLQSGGEHAAALDHLLVALALSRQLRHKAPSYFVSSADATQSTALSGLERWFAHVGPQPALLRRALAGLTLHGEELPAAADNIKARSYEIRMLADGLTALVAAGGSAVEVQAAAAPWERERDRRLWNLAFASHLRGAATPYWDTEAMRPVADGTLPGIDRERDESVPWVRAAWRTRWGAYLVSYGKRWPGAQEQVECEVRALRLLLALAIYEIDQGKPPASLGDLVPRYLKSLPTDPFSGKAFGYRVSPGERIATHDGRGKVMARDVAAGQAVLWSAGPDRTDHGGRRDGPRHSSLGRGGWGAEDLDLIYLAPRWAK